jgi:hypothetical protein
MSTTSKLTFEEFVKLPEQEGTTYELDEGELLMEPSPTFRHNRIRSFPRNPVGIGGIAFHQGTVQECSRMARTNLARGLFPITAIATVPPLRICINKLDMPS